MSLLSLVFYLTEHHVVKFVKKLLGEKEIEATLQRIDRLTQDEARTTAAETLKVVHSLVQGMRGAMDCEQYCAGLVILCQLITLPSRWQSIL